MTMYAGITFFPDILYKRILCFRFVRSVGAFCSYCPPDLTDFDELLEESNDRLFRKTLNNPFHTLHALLPPQSTTSQHYHLRKRTHDRQLPAHRGHLSDRNFVTWVLYKHTYWKYYCLLLLTLLSLLYIINCVLSVSNKEYDDDDDDTTIAVCKILSDRLRFGSMRAKNLFLSNNYAWLSRQKCWSNISHRK